MKAVDGMHYAPKGKPDPVVKPGEFVFSAVGLDHGHIYGMTNGLLEAGATLKYVYDPDPEKVEAYRKAYPQASAARSEEEVLADPETSWWPAPASPASAPPWAPGDAGGQGLLHRQGAPHHLGAAGGRHAPSRRRAASTWSITASACRWRGAGLPGS